MNQPKVLLVDDDPHVLASLSRHLHADYRVWTAENGVDALRVAEAERPISVMVTDYRMPSINGVELASRMRTVSPDTVRILLTGNADLEMAIAAINQGDIFRFLLKPCPKDTLLQNVMAGVEQYQLVTAERELLDKTLKGSIKVLADVLAMTSPEIFNHSTSLRILARSLGIRLEVEDLWEVELAISLCQIGCVTLPKEILQMKERRQFATEKDRLNYYQHPKIGRSLVGNIPRLEGVADGIAYQHKNFDGTGYPQDDKKGEEIPFLGRLLKVILDYDELVQLGANESRALQMLTEREGACDPSILGALRAELSGRKELRKKSIPIAQLEPGMVLAGDVTDHEGRVLIASKTQITDVLKIRLSNYQVYHTVMEPVLILAD